LDRFIPPSADSYEIDAGSSIRKLLQQLGIPEKKARLIFIDGVKASLDDTLSGGERVGIFPPVGGG